MFEPFQDCKSNRREAGPNFLNQGDAMKRKFTILSVVLLNLILLPPLAQAQAKKSWKRLEEAANREAYGSKRFQHEHDKAKGKEYCDPTWYAEGEFGEEVKLGLCQAYIDFLTLGEAKHNANVNYTVYLSLTLALSAVTATIPVWLQDQEDQSKWTTSLGAAATAATGVNAAYRFKEKAGLIDANASSMQPLLQELFGGYKQYRAATPEKQQKWREETFYPKLKEMKSLYAKAMETW